GRRVLHGVRGRYLSQLLVGTVRGRRGAQGAARAARAGCDSAVSPQVGDDAGGLSAWAAAEPEISSAAGLSESRDDGANVRGDFERRERGPITLGSNVLDDADEKQVSRRQSFASDKKPTVTRAASWTLKNWVIYDKWEE